MIIKQFKRYADRCDNVFLCMSVDEASGKALMYDEHHKVEELFNIDGRYSDANNQSIYDLVCEVNN
jgi:hypothetical protein